MQVNFTGWRHLDNNDRITKITDKILINKLKVSQHKHFQKQTATAWTIAFNKKLLESQRPHGTKLGLPLIPFNILRQSWLRFVAWGTHLQNKGLSRLILSIYIVICLFHARRNLFWQQRTSLDTFNINCDLLIWCTRNLFWQNKGLHLILSI